MITFSNIDVGAGSSAEFTRPHLPTTLSTSGMEFTFKSNKRITSIFSSIPECGMVVGISKKDPSSSEGINSFPIPGKVSVKELNDLLFLIPFGKNPNILSTPCQLIIPKNNTMIGMLKNLPLFRRLQFKILG